MSTPEHIIREFVALCEALPDDPSPNVVVALVECADSTHVQRVLSSYRGTYRCAGCTATLATGCPTYSCSRCGFDICQACARNNTPLGTCGC